MTKNQPTNDRAAEEAAPQSRLARLFRQTTTTAASWTGRAPYGASSGHAPTPGEAGETTRRQGARDQAGEAEPVPTPAPPSVVDELAAARPLDAPPLPSPTNRRRTREKRTVEAKIRLTPSADAAIRKAASACGKRRAGFIGDAALAAALTRPATTGGPEDDPARPLIAALDAIGTELRRQGGNLNQIARALNHGSLPDELDTVLRAQLAVQQHLHRVLDTVAGKEG